MVQNVKWFEENVIEMSSPNIHVLNLAFFFGPFQHQRDIVEPPFANGCIQFVFPAK